MNKKILAIQGSSLKKINIKTDTSFFLGLEAQKRNYDIYYYEPKDLSFVDNKVIARCSKIKFQNNLKKPVRVFKKIKCSTYLATRSRKILIKTMKCTLNKL